MSFLTPWMLWGLTAISAPILIHLWQRRQVVRLPFSTLRFLKIAATKTRKSAILENLFLLLLRCLLFALLIAAAARPVMTTKMARMFGGSVPRMVILAIDNSMSMGCVVNGSTRLEVAKKQALAVLESLKDTDEVTLIAASGVPQMLIPKPTLDHKIVRTMIEGVQITEDLSDVPALVGKVRRMAENERESFREFYFFTDAQATAWGFDPKGIFDASWENLSMHSVIVLPDDLSPPNTSLSSVRITSPMALSGSLLTGVAVLDNYSGENVSDVMEIRIGGERIFQVPVEFPPHATLEVPFEGKMPEVNGRWVEGVARIQSDNLPADDSFLFAIPVAQRAKALVVEGEHPGEEMLCPGFYLRKALQIGDPYGILPDVILPAQLDDISLDDYTTLFLADVPSLSDRALVRIDRYLDGGGTVVFFPGDLTDPSKLARLDFLPAKAMQMMDLPPGRLATLVSEPTNPLVARTWDKSTPFPALPQRKLMQWESKRDVKTVLSFSNGVPFVIEQSRGAGTVLIVNAAADRSWGDFPLSPAFLPLIQQIARLSTERGAATSSYRVGESLPMTPNLPTDQTLTLRDPDGKNTTIPAGDKSSLVDHVEHSGIYSVSSGKDGVVQMYAVNADRRESDLHPIGKEALQKMLPSEMLSGFDPLRLWLTQSKGTIPLWPPLLLAALAVFTLEGFLSNLLAKNRSQGNEKGIRTGRLNKRRFGAVFRPGVKEVMP